MLVQLSCQSNNYVKKSIKLIHLELLKVKHHQKQFRQRLNTILAHTRFETVILWFALNS